METPVDLLGGMGVVPECACVGRPEAVIEAGARLDGRLREVRHAVHGIGTPHPVPMEARRLGKLIEEPKMQLLALSHPQQRAGDGAVVGESCAAFQNSVYARMQDPEGSARFLLRL